MNVWCEHCRDHFDGDHYNDDGAHLVGPTYGPEGRLLALANLAQQAYGLINGFLYYDDEAKEWIADYEAIDSNAAAVRLTASE